MAIQNDFLPFATASGANVVTQAQYAALAALSTGYQSGVAPSAQLNKTWRQSSIMAAVLAQFIADNTGQNATDDGTTATLEANLLAAIRSATKTSVILADTGTANAYTAVNVPPLTSSTWSDGVFQEVKIAHSNTGASTYAPDGLTAIPIYGLGLQPLQGGELALNGTAVLMRATIAGVNSGNPIAVLMECAGGAQQVAPATKSQHAVQLGQISGIVGQVRNLSMSVATASASATLTADEIIVETALGGIRYCLSGFNKTINLATTGAGGMDTGTAPTNGYVALYAIYNPSTSTSALLAANATAGSVPNFYGGTLPSGYTASALVSVWPTNGSGQFVVGIQADRTVGLAPTLQLNTSTQQTSLTALTVTTGVPPNAKAAYGEVSIQTTSSSAMACSVASSPNNLMESNIANQNAVQIRTVFQRTLLVTPQTLYYIATVGSGTMTFQLWTTGYDF
ncbi:hypothetical protein ACI2VH_02995 [Ralstonia nicotianae]